MIVVVHAFLSGQNVFQQNKKCSVPSLTTWGPSFSSVLNYERMSSYFSFPLYAILIMFFQGHNPALLEQNNLLRILSLPVTIKIIDNVCPRSSTTIKWRK